MTVPPAAASVLISIEVWNGSRAAVPSAGAHSRCTLYCGRTVILPKASRRCQHRTIEVHQDDLAPLLRMRAEEGGDNGIRFSEVAPERGTAGAAS